MVVAETSQLRHNIIANSVVVEATNPHAKQHTLLIIIGMLIMHNILKVKAIYDNQMIT